jgi:aerobic-type carbon monoxide dehydrogenase small subunit (CoxS/CutS family)
VRYSILVNGRRHDVEATPETPLLWVLWDHLGFTGIKFGCGVGACGACMVPVDGAPLRLCLTPVPAIGDRRIATIEDFRPMAIWNCAS